MKVTDERAELGSLDDLNPVIRELLEKLREDRADHFELALRDNWLFSPYTNGCYLYTNFYPEDEAELRRWVEARHWCHFSVRPDEDNPGYWYISVLDPQAVCPVILSRILYPQF